VITLTEEQAVTLMRQVVFEYGEDYTYTAPEVEDPDLGVSGSTCMYVLNNKPSCLLGHVLHRAGVPLQTLHQHEYSLVSALFKPVGDIEPPCRAEPYLVEALLAAQSQQDNGQSWGEAEQEFLHSIEKNQG
jgi:hypothetical protein